MNFSTKQDLHFPLPRCVTLNSSFCSSLSLSFVGCTMRVITFIHQHMGWNKIGPNTNELIYKKEIELQM